MDSESLKSELAKFGLIELNGERFIIDLMYAGTRNIASFAAYEEIGLGNRAFVHLQVFENLMKIVPILENNHLKMCIRDAYRPPLAHILLQKKVAIPGLFAANYQLSNHCHGTAVDVCLADESGKLLSYPTETDAYSDDIAQAVRKGNFTPLQENLCKARHDYMQAPYEALANRSFLKELMEDNGFLSIPHEWWHYNLKGFEKYPVIETDLF